MSAFGGQVADRQVADKVARGAASLPVEIAFLKEHGIPHHVLRDAAALAAACGVSPDEAILRHGLVGEEQFYRCLAATLGLPFVEGEMTPDPRTSFPAAILSGLVPLRVDGRPGPVAAAPRAAALRKVLAEPARFANLVVTTPTAVRRTVFAARGPAIAAQAAHALPHARPEHSYRGGSSALQRAAFGLAAIAAALVLLHEPGVLASALPLLLVPIFLAVVILRLAAAAEHAAVAPALPPRRLPDRVLPAYTILVPLFREGAVVPQLLAAIAALDYPAAKLDVKLILEEGDRETADAIARAALPGFVEVIVAPAGEPRTKPRALNVALPLARGEFTVVYDAEDAPDPAQLRLAVATFERMRPDVACLQARLVIDNTNDNWLTRLFTIEYAALFDVINPGLAALGCPVPLGGTSNHFRTEVLKEIGGWDAWNVTEDADLGIRLALCGYGVADLPSSTFEEAPAALGAWMRQRSRWIKGFLQVCVTHSRHPLRTLAALGPVAFCAAVAATLGTVVAAAGFPLLTALAVAAIATGDLLRPESFAELGRSVVGLTVFAAGLAAMLVPPLVALRRRGWWELLPLLPTLPLYYGLITVAAVRGLAELLLQPSHWNKTDHGLARTSRRLRGAPGQVGQRT